MTIAGACLLSVALGCASHVSRQERSDPEAQVTISSAARAWHVVQDGRVLGILVEFEERDGPRGFFSVRNPQHQELGMVDEHGRSWRYRPHAEEPEWLGTGTVLEGVRGILGLGPGAELVEVDLALLAPAGA